MIRIASAYGRIGFVTIEVDIMLGSKPLQRTTGRGAITIGRRGNVRELREEGAACIRLPDAGAFGAAVAVLINTAGGLTGGDSLAWTLVAEPAARLTVTTQAAEKIYRSMGDSVTISTNLKAGDGAQLYWIPQETILFDRARLSRDLDAAISADARLLIAELVVFGRKAMGETLSDFSFRDRWRIKRSEKLVFAETASFDANSLQPRAALNGARAMASLVLVAPDAETFLDRLRDILGSHGGASAWDGKLVARLVAEDGYELRRRLVPALKLLAGAAALPKVWSI